MNPTTEQAEALRKLEKALRLAFTLGQNYWADADSESYSANKRADGYRQKFEALVQDTLAALASPAVSAEPVAYQWRRLIGIMEPFWTEWDHCSRESYEYAMKTEGYEGRVLYTHSAHPSKRLIDDEIEALAHRMAWRYRKSTDPNHSDTYTFNRSTLLAFASSLATHPKAEPAGVPVYQFEVWQGDDFCASGDAPTLEAMRVEANRYAAQYVQDGPISVREFVRYELPAAPSASQDKEADRG